MADKKNTAAPLLGGERTIASVTADKGRRSLLTSPKVLVLGGIAAAIAIYASFGFEQDKPDPTAQVENEETRIRTMTQFQPAEFKDSVPLARAQTAPEPIKTAFVGPIERVRQTQHAAPAAPTNTKDLLLAARRAPVVAFGENKRIATPTPDAAAPGTGLIVGASGQTGKDPSTLATALKTTSLEGARASVIPAPHLTLTQGATIPCTLDTAMDSTLGGMVRCTVTDDIFGTTGTVVLLEKGTKIVGEYRGGVRRGQNRLFVIWTRAETPKGVLIALGSPATDSLGRTGFDGVVDTQFWTRFSGTILLSIVDDALAIAANQHDDELEHIRAGARNMASIELESTINIPVILRKPQGEEVAVMVARDLDFSSVYQLKAR